MIRGFRTIGIYRKLFIKNSCIIQPMLSVELSLLSFLRLNELQTIIPLQ